MKKGTGVKRRLHSMGLPGGQCRKEVHTSAAAANSSVITWWRVGGARTPGEEQVARELSRTTASLPLAETRNRPSHRTSPAV